MRLNRLAGALLASCLLVVGIAGLSSPAFGQCSRCSNPIGYTQLGNRTPDEYADYCRWKRDSICYDCTANCGGTWIHCVESEGGEYGMCGIYPDFSSIPFPGQVCGTTLCDPFAWTYYI